MKNLLFVMLLTALGSVSCSSTAPKIFGKKTPHEQYADKIDKQDLDETPLGRQWLAASQTALVQPAGISLPYSLQGHFPTDKPRALGLQFEGRAGQKITVELKKRSNESFVIYTDLYRQQASGADHLLSADTLANSFTYDIDEPGTYVLRLQPELFRTGAYELRISTGPSLGFPVGGKASIGSFWGDVRDGGARSHEGIDIFAPKRTPAIAAADGMVTAVREGGIGGKTVWFRPFDKPYTLYYAHLDEQLVQPGQNLKRGDTLGLVGNTGNAQHTPPHLHFGIYTMGGPVDPLVYVNRTIGKAPAIPQKKLQTYMKLAKERKEPDGSTTRANTLVVPLAVSSGGYIAELPGGQQLLTSFASLEKLDAPVKKVSARAPVTVYNGTGVEKKVSTTIQPGNKVSVMAYYNEFALVQTAGGEGWVLGSELGI